MKKSPWIFFVLAFGVHAAFAASDEPGVTTEPSASVTILDVKQRWPWNNKVDISYRVEGGQKRAAGVYFALRFEMTVGANVYTNEGYAMGASAETNAENESHHVTWTMPEGLVSDQCSLVATLYTTNVPSGDDYMIVDLNDGRVWYEGLMQSQEDSNARYLQALYKEDYLVLRKVPKWADRAALPNASVLSAMTGYPTGDSDNYSKNNAYRNLDAYWATDRDYYAGVYPVTKAQFQKITGITMPARHKKEVEGDVILHRPVTAQSWDDLRLADTPPNEPIPCVNEPHTGNFFQRLNYLTGNQFQFDLPTEVMCEIANRAGATTCFYWGDEMDSDYVVCTENTVGTVLAVGSRTPNAWGFFDVSGNVWELCRDFHKVDNLAERSDAFTPAYGEEGHLKNEDGIYLIRSRNGMAYNGSRTSANFKASHRNNYLKSGNYAANGFRVYRICE